MRSAILYVVLVGVPTLGVLATLRAGERVDAPVHIGGTWRVVAGDGCAVRPGDEIEVVQSGEYLSVAWPDGARARGTFRGGRLDVTRPESAAVRPGCSSDPVRLVAEPASVQAGGAGAVTRLAGTETPCAGCAGRAFAWARVPRASSAPSGGH